MKPTDWIDQVAAKHGKCSDYRVAQILGMSKQGISNYRKGRSAALDDAVAHRVEGELGLPLGTVIMDQRAEREQDPEMRSVWRQLGKLAASAGHGAAAGILATICLVSGLAFVPQNQAHADDLPLTKNIHYAQLRLRL